MNNEVYEGESSHSGEIGHTTLEIDKDLAIVEKKAA